MRPTSPACRSRMRSRPPSPRWPSRARPSRRPTSRSPFSHARTGGGRSGGWGTTRWLPFWLDLARNRRGQGGERLPHLFAERRAADPDEQVLPPERDGVEVDCERDRRTALVGLDVPLPIGVRG